MSTQVDLGHPSGHCRCDCHCGVHVKMELQQQLQRIKSPGVDMDTSSPDPGSFKCNDESAPTLAKDTDSATSHSLLGLQECDNGTAGIQDGASRHGNLLHTVLCARRHLDEVMTHLGGGRLDLVTGSIPMAIPQDHQHS